MQGQLLHLLAALALVEYALSSLIKPQRLDRVQIVVYEVRLATV